MGIKKKNIGKKLKTGVWLNRAMNNYFEQQFENEDTGFQEVTVTDPEENTGVLFRKMHLKYWSRWLRKLFRRREDDEQAIPV